MATAPKPFWSRRVQNVRTCTRVMYAGSTSFCTRTTPSLRLAGGAIRHGLSAALSRSFGTAPAVAQQAMAEAQRLEITAVGAHMRDMALNGQLLELGATFVREAKTAPVYRFYSLGARPLLVRQAQQDSSSASINLEVWSVPMDNVGRFLAKIPSPLGLGTVLLDDGSSVMGFIGEAFAASQEDAVEITHFGGWRAYLASKQ